MNLFNATIYKRIDEEHAIGWCNGTIPRLLRSGEVGALSTPDADSLTDLRDGTVLSVRLLPCFRFLPRIARPLSVTGDYDVAAHGGGRSEPVGETGDGGIDFSLAGVLKIEGVTPGIVSELRTLAKFTDFP